MAVRPPRRPVSATLVLPPGGLVIAPGKGVRVAMAFRRFGSTVRPGGAIAGGATLVTAPFDRSPVPWVLDLASAGPFRIC
jgi:hypothetical protein